MEEKLNRLKDIKTENYIWIIYIGIIILSFYANELEKKFILYDDEEARKNYQNTIILIFSILVIIYYYFANSDYKNLKNLNETDTDKKIILTFLSFIGSSLVLISGIIFLIIAYLDEEISIELAFN